MTRSLSTLIFLTGLLATGSVSAADSPSDLFERMLLASTNLRYSGLLAYEGGDTLRTFRVETDTQGQQQLQTILPLNFALPARTRIAACRSAQTDRSPLASYDLLPAGETLVAGRVADEILLVPRDYSRYGYAFAIDRETGLMLRKIVLSSSREALERAEFVDISFASESNGIAPRPICEHSIDNQQWSFQSLPEGFELSSTEANDTNNEFRALISDGLSSVSVLIEPVDQASFPAVSTRVGATTVLLIYLPAGEGMYLVTLVGEVPLGSLELIASTMTYAEDGDAP